MTEEGVPAESIKTTPPSDWSGREKERGGDFRELVLSHSDLESYGVPERYTGSS